MQNLTSCEHERLMMRLLPWSRSRSPLSGRMLRGSQSAGVQELSGLQRLEVLHVPYTRPHTIAQLAAHLPALRSLDLWCCSKYAHKEAVGQLTLAAATALTELRLHVCAAAADTVRRLQMPPNLQVLAPACYTVVCLQCARPKAGMQLSNVNRKSLDVSAPLGEVEY